MAGVVFYFESNDIDVHSGRSVDLDAWNYAIKAAGDINKVIIINKTPNNINKFDADLDIDIVKDLPELTGSVTTICCPWDKCDNKVSLWNFNHRTDWYFFGPANGWRQKIDGLGLYIPLASEAALHSVHIASVVLTHRYGVLCQ